MTVVAHWCHSWKSAVYMVPHTLIDQGAIWNSEKDAAFGSKLEKHFVSRPKFATTPSQIGRKSLQSCDSRPKVRIGHSKFVVNFEKELPDFRGCESQPLQNFRCSPDVQYRKSLCTSQICKIDAIANFLKLFRFSDTHAFNSVQLF